MIAKHIHAIRKHDQETPLKDWTIDHNLGYEPIVAVTVEISGTWQTILPSSIEHTSTDQVVIRFSRPRSGRARLA